MRIMGLDFGAKTVGVAISDPLLVTAQGIEIIRRKENKKQKSICILAGDVSPIDVISHIPILCEKNKVPYIYIPSLTSPLSSFRFSFFNSLSVL